MSVITGKDNKQKIGTIPSSLLRTADDNPLSHIDDGHFGDL